MRIRCPHCDDRIEVLNDDPLVELNCPNCGRDFNIVGGSAATTSAWQKRTIGHFELLDELGRGAHGSVWKAHDAELDRLVAVKLPRKEQLDDTEAEQFLREARAAAQLRNPNLVSVHEVGREKSGQLYIISDLVDGANLSEWLEAKRPGLEQSVFLLVQLAEAIEYAHQQGVIHRDLKPSNILIDQAGAPYITDFGLAKREVGEVTMTLEGKILGTPAYMSPEQAAGQAHDVDGRSDVYSLGVIFFELLTGELPFRGSQRMLIMQILHDDPPSPRKLNARVPKDLETIILKCLEKDRQRRYRSAADLAKDLKHYLAREPITARPVSPPARLWRWCRRRPLVASLSGAVLSLLLVLGIGGPLVALQQIVLTGSAEASKEAAKASAAESRARLAEMETLNAVREIDGGDYSAALLWLVRALENEGGKELEPVNRRRFAALLDKSPKVLQLQPGLRGIPIDNCPWRVTLSANQSSFQILAPESESPISPVLEGHATDGQPAGPDEFAVSPDRSFLASMGSSGAVIWKTEDWSQHWVLPGVKGVTFAGDDLIVSWTSRRLSLWDVAQKREIAVRDFDYIREVQPVLGGARIFTDAFGRGLAENPTQPVFSFWSVPDLNPAVDLTRNGKPYLGFDAEIRVAPDGWRLAIADGSGELSVWNAQTGKAIAGPMAHPTPVTRLAFSPDGQWLVTACRDGTVRIWNSLDGGLLATPLHSWSPCTELRFSGDMSQLIVSTAADQDIVWDISCLMKLPTRYPFTKKLVKPAFLGSGICASPGGRRFMTWIAYEENGGVTHSLNLVDVVRKSRRPLKLAGWHPVVLSGKWFHGGAGVVVLSKVPSSRNRGDSALLAWSTTTGKLVATARLKYRIGQLRFGPEGKLFCVCLSRGAAIFSSQDLTELASTNDKVPCQVMDVAFANDGTVFLSTADGVIKWDHKADQTFADHDVRSRDSRLSRKNSFTNWIQLSPDESTVASIQSNEVLVLDRKTLRRKCTPLVHLSEVTHLTFDPSSERIYTVSENTGYLWHAATGRILAQGMKHDHPVAYGAFSVDGLFIVSAAGRGLRIWDAGTGLPVTPTLEQLFAPSYASFSSDRVSIVAAGRGSAMSGGVVVRDFWAEAKRTDQLRSIAYRCSGGRKLLASGFITTPDRDLLIDLLAQDPPDPPPAALIRTFHRQRALELYDRSDWFSAEWHLNWLVENERNPKPYVKLQGYCRLCLGRYREAAGDFDRVLAEGDTSVESLKLASDAHLRASHWDRTVDLAKEVLSSDPNDRDALRYLAISLASTDRWDDAAATFERLSGSDPRSPHRLSSILCRFAAGDRSKFESIAAGLFGSAVEKVRQIRERDDSAWQVAGRLARATGVAVVLERVQGIDYDQLLQMLGDPRLSEKQPNRSAFSGELLICAALLRSGRYESAIAQSKIALKEPADHRAAILWLLQGLAEAGSNQHDAARACLVKAKALTASRDWMTRLMRKTLREELEELLVGGAD